MTDLDRLLELTRSGAPLKEYQSLYEKLSKAEKWSEWNDELVKINNDLKQNQRTPEDIEKIQKIEEELKKATGGKYDNSDEEFAKCQECNLWKKIQSILKESK